MAYKIMKRVIALNTKPKEELLEMCDVYYAVGRLTKEQYEELIELINK